MLVAEIVGAEGCAVAGGSARAGQRATSARTSASWPGSARIGVAVGDSPRAS